MNARSKNSAAESTDESFAATPLPSHRIKQKRGRKTYDALIATGFKLLEEKEFESISIAELARAAGYSVGAFYARFYSKDEFFDAMVSHYLAQRQETQRRIIGSEPIDLVVAKLIENIVTYYWNHRRFWRAALMRSIRDESFWEPIGVSSHNASTLLIERICRHIGRQLSEEEENNLRFAFQVVYGTINNAIINRPGPVFIGQVEFIDNLTLAFFRVSEYEKLGIEPVVGKKKIRGP